MHPVTFPGVLTETTITTLPEVPAPENEAPLSHGLRPFFEEMATFDSTKELESSAIFKRLRPEISRVLDGVVCENRASPVVSAAPEQRGAIRVVAWNLERGIRLEGITAALRDHARMRESDLLLLTELDYGMARTRNRFIAREIAEALGLNYVFAPCYLALNKGSGLESRAGGENTLSLHGNALLSRHPATRAHSLALPNGKDKMRGKEKRLGCQRAVIADIEHPEGTFRAVSLHLDAHSTQRHRHRQMRLVLDHLETLRPALPVIIGGDWNTSTYNSRRALYSIAGFARRVMMGVEHVLTTHYLHPDRYFERGLFTEIERRGYGYRELNEQGAGTLHYDVKDIAVNENMADWVPAWCFAFINRALEPHAGRCSLKLDWFAGKGIAPSRDAPPKVISGLRDSAGPLSDHDPIVLEFTLS